MQETSQKGQQVVKATASRVAICGSLSTNNEGGVTGVARVLWDERDPVQRMAHRRVLEGTG